MKNCQIFSWFGWQLVAAGWAASLAFAQPAMDKVASSDSGTPTSPFIEVLGIAQDGGYPHAGCRKECCRDAWQDPKAQRYVSCLGLVDPLHQQKWILDATPDLPHQLERLTSLLPDSGPAPDGVLLTHAHIGHYTGLMHLGREVMGTKQVKVYAMPRMAEFLKSQGPWSQLVELQNISIQPIQADESFNVNARIQVTPLVVPHRDEFSETVAFVVRGPARAALFLPDIDKWDRWGTRIEQVLTTVDVAFLDGTFFDNDEIPHRDMSEIPHPFIAESIKRFSNLPSAERGKIHFIHLNHTNAAMQPESPATATVAKAGMHIARRGLQVDL